MSIEFAPPHIYQRAQDIIQVLRMAGHEAYIAGGAVRDYLMGRPQSDLDIATSARPDQVMMLFARTFAVGENFGVVIVHHHGHDFEVATFREEADYRDGRHPDTVRFSTARADVARRDFTINGMMWDPSTETLMDWVGGSLDIRDRRIRTIGTPDARFTEDRLRMLRAVRFAAQLDFDIDPPTLAAIRAQAEQLTVVSLERVRQELDKLLSAPAAGKGLRLLHDSGLWAVLRRWLRREAQQVSRRRVPAFGDLDDRSWQSAWLLAIGEGQHTINQDMWRFGLIGMLLDIAGLSQERFSIAGAHDNQWVLGSLMRAMRGSRQDVCTAEVTAQILGHLSAFPSLRLADQLRVLRQAETPALLAVACHHPWFRELPMATIAALNVRYAQMWRPVPLLCGTDLLELGCPRGATVGVLLHDLESLQLEGSLVTSADARQWVLRHLHKLDGSTTQR